MDPPTSWDSLRKQARKLEAQLDDQMYLYRKLVATKVDSSTDKDLESGVEQLLRQLKQVISHMQAWVSSGGSEIYSHTLTRHQEILLDLTQEFNRLRSSLRAKKEHASLLEDFSDFDRTRLDLEEGAGSGEQALLKEHASISRSTGQMDSVISQAQGTLGTLVFQRSMFGGINSKLSNVSGRLPTKTQGESYPHINKEEKVHGYYHHFLSCFCLHISHSDLLAAQIGNVAILSVKSRDRSSICL
ncbi:hypothetical protein RHMOL_Rhmol07G0189500 [Rhododendron molle]|uniref:Uncharacterized protein n=1 Tax=Rhododendron molle TaxID=49168 RepID=A0ACC0N2H4_RHOML|nr:hypothetical protein RHMOL_Rhmol07G0189500 [Rhododendron molle]